MGVILEALVVGETPEGGAAMVAVDAVAESVSQKNALN